MNSRGPRQGGLSRVVARAGWGFLLLALLSGCVAIPYRPESETRRDLAAVPNPERIRLSIGPRKFLAEMGEALRDEERRIELVDGQTFIDTAAPAGDLSLARLLDPATRALIAPLQTDYLVLLGAPHDEVLDEWGGVGTWIGFYGIGKSTESSAYWAAVVDLRDMRIVEQLTTTSTGTDAGVGLFYGIFVVSDTNGAAQKGVIRNLAKTLAARNPEGPLRLVLLAKEPLLTAQDLAVEARRRELQERRAIAGLPMLGTGFYASDLADGYPTFSEAPAPVEGEGLVYLYRPEQAMGGLLPLSIRADAGQGEFEVTRLLSGGYYPCRVPAGPLRLWVATDPDAGVALEVPSGGTAFVRGGTRMGWKSPHGELTVVVADKARPEVTHLRRLPSMRDYVEETKKRAEEGYTYKQLELARLYSLGVTYGAGESLPLDRVESYKWYTVVMESTGALPWMRDGAQRDRGILGNAMSADEKAAGYRLGHEWLQAFEQAFLAAPAADPAGATAREATVAPTE